MEVEETKLRILLLALGIVATSLSIIKTVLDLLEKLEAKQKAHNRSKPRKHKKRK